MNEVRPRWKHVLNSMYSTWRDSPLLKFCVWWRRELLMSLPERLRQRLERSHIWYLLVLEGGCLEVRRSDVTKDVVRIDIDMPQALREKLWLEALSGTESTDLRLVLCLPPGEVLRRVLLLPHAARADIDRVLEFEIDRQTPFRATEVVFAANRLQDMEDGRLQVELVVVPKSQLEPRLDQLRSMGIHVDAVDALVDSQQVRQLA